MSCGIYKITSPSGKCYIGQSVNIERRWSDHRSRKCSHCLALKNAIEKYGVENMIFEILEELPRDKVILNEKEIYYIELYNCISPDGYNLTTGGESFEMSKETKQKMSEAKKGKPPNNKGKPAWNKGKTPSEETRKKLSESHKGKQSPNKGKKFNKLTRKYE